MSIQMTAETELALEVDRAFFRLHPTARFFIRPPLPFEVQEFRMQPGEYILVRQLEPGARLRQSINFLHVPLLTERPQ